MPVYLYVIVGVVVLAAIWVVLIFNHLVRLSNEAKRGWSNIDVQLKRRTDLIPNLVEAVKGYAAHEREVFEAVTAARVAMQQATGPAQAGAANKQASAALGRLFAVAEAYPELKANIGFQQLQQELTNTEDRIAAGRRFYNANVRELNTKIEIFPTNVIAGMFGFTKAEYFEVDDQAVRTTPEVKF